ARRRPGHGTTTSTAATARTRVNWRAPPGNPASDIFPGKPPNVAHGDRLPTINKVAPTAAAGRGGTRATTRSSPKAVAALTRSRTVSVTSEPVPPGARRDGTQAPG